MKTYTPGFFWTKIFFLVISLFVLCAGLYDLWFPAQLVLYGTKTRAAIVRVEKAKPGFPLQTYSTTASIPEEVNRDATFSHFIEFTTPDGATISTRLNIASQQKPVYSVGQKVSIAYNKRKPQIAIALYDQRTWAVGFFVSLVGLFFGLASFFMALHARKPIELPDDTPDEDPAIKETQEARARALMRDQPSPKQQSPAELS